MAAKEGGGTPARPLVLEIVAGREHAAWIPYLEMDTSREPWDTEAFDTWAWEEGEDAKPWARLRIGLLRARDSCQWATIGVTNHANRKASKYITYVSELDEARRHVEGALNGLDEARRVLAEYLWCERHGDVCEALDARPQELRLSEGGRGLRHSTNYWGKGNRQAYDDALLQLNACWLDILDAARAVLRSEGGEDMERLRHANAYARRAVGYAVGAAQAIVGQAYRERYGPDEALPRDKPPAIWWAD